MGTTVFPGMMFSLSKERMEGTRLWRIVRRMPKGALLHGHMDAMVDFDHLFAILLATPGMHIYADRPLDGPAAREDAKISFRFRRRAHTEGDVWAASYEPMTPVLVTQAADAFPDSGRAGFLKWRKQFTGHCLFLCFTDLFRHILAQRTPPPFFFWSGQVEGYSVIRRLNRPG